jgi:DNA-binding transcriptional ArsR family regulator
MNAAPDFAVRAEALRAIAHPVRLELLWAIMPGELAVSDIESTTGIGQPGLSQQLGVLRKAELVETRREAKQVFYRIDAERMGEIADLLCQLAGRTRASGTSSSGRPPKRHGSAAAFARVV